MSHPQPKGRWKFQTNLMHLPPNGKCTIVPVSNVSVFFAWIKKAYFWDTNSVTCEILLKVPVVLQLKKKQHCKKVSVLADCLHHSDDGFAVSNDAPHQTSVTTYEYKCSVITTWKITDYMYRNYAKRETSQYMDQDVTCFVPCVISEQFEHCVARTCTSLIKSADVLKG